PIKARKLAATLRERGREIGNSGLKRWAVRFERHAPARRAWRGARAGWRLVETPVKTAGERKYLYRAVGKRGRAVESFLSARRDPRAAARVLRKAIVTRRGRDTVTTGERRRRIARRAASPQARPAPSRARSFWLHTRRTFWVVLIAVTVFGLWVVADESGSSRLQARYLSEYARNLTFFVQPGPAADTKFAPGGPYDLRLGYSHLPGFLNALAARSYVITEQARVSPELARLADFGLSPVYREKDQVGLALVDCAGQPLYSERFPERIYDRFEAIPPVLVDTLLFIEDQALLDAEHPKRNPAIEWKRFGLAVFDQLWHLVDKSHPAAGGSTLATQIEKYRHSPDGRTASAREKLRQMASASVRAYLAGEDTLAARRKIVASYLSTVPLSAKPGYGEINSIGDGMWAWYGRDFDEVNRLLNAVSPAAAEANGELQRQAEAYKQVLSLMIAQRRPSYYLAEGKQDLEELTNSYLRLLGAAGVIPPALRDAALPIELAFHEDPGAPPPVSFVTRKAATAMRTHLSGLLNVPRLYDLDRFDLAASSTLA